jgi:16S rRNA (adenine1518-N6/adenine1519-N6)-dimethyltransferase
MSEEIFEVVDKSGKVIGKEKRAIVHRRGLLHKSIHAFVLDKQGRVFIQQRSFDRFIAPGKCNLLPEVLKKS